MNHYTAIEVLETLLPTIKEAGAPENVLLQYASEHNLAPAQLEKMAQVFNTAKTLTYLDKAANRGGSFSVVDTQDLLKQYQAYEAPTERVMDKAASAPITHNPLRFPGPGVYAPTVKAADIDDDLQRHLRQAERWAQTEQRNTLKKVAEFQDEQQEIVLECVEKLARISRVVDKSFSNQQMQMDMAFVMGKSAAESLIKDVWGTVMDFDMEDVHDKRAFDQGMRQNSGRLEVLEIVSELLEAQGMRKDAGAYASELIKSAGGVEGPLTYEQRLTTDVNTHNMQELLSKLKPGKGKPPKPVESHIPDPLDIGPAASDIESKMVRPMSDKLNKIDPSQILKLLHVEPSKYNKAQKEVDETRTDTERSVVLARLMQSDPIISEADPDTVQDIYNSLQDASPEFVRDPSRLRMALREAVEYGAVPIHTLNELTTYRKNLAGARKDEHTVDTDTYGI